MIARVTAFKATDDAFDEIARVYEGQVVPWLESATGFSGMMFLFDRPAGKGLALSFWADAEALAAAEEGMERFRALVGATVGTTSLGIEEYEVAVTGRLRLP